MRARGKLPEIGPQDFVRFSRIINSATLQAERMEAFGYPKFAREFRDIAKRVADIDSEFYLSNRK